MKRRADHQSTKGKQMSTNNGITRRAAALGMAAAPLVGSALAQARTEITLARFYGSCEADYGNSTDVEAARGECGVITTLVNRFNATNTDAITVRPQIIEWGPYYQQLTARIAARDVPTIAIMHGSQIGDFARTRLLEPIEEDLTAAGIDVNDMTPNARRGVTFNGRIHAFPFDTHSWLWHVNSGLFREAGLVGTDGQPVMPRTTDELMAQAVAVRQRTGKPYFMIGSIASADVGNSARTFFTLLQQQNVELMPEGAERPDFNQPAVRNTFEWFDRLAKDNHFTKGLDGAGALSGFIGGGGAVYLTGTWRIDDLLNAAQRPASGLREYTARVFPTLHARDSVWTDNATWVMLRGGTNDRTRRAARVFMRYLWDNNFQWARGGGHLPVRQSLMAQYAQLPERPNIMRIPEIGRAALPDQARRQFGLFAIIGEELNNIINGGKAVTVALRDSQERSDQLLSRR